MKQHAKLVTMVTLALLLFADAPQRAMAGDFPLLLMRNTGIPTVQVVNVPPDIYNITWWYCPNPEEDCSHFLGSGVELFKQFNPDLVGEAIRADIDVRKDLRYIVFAVVPPQFELHGKPMQNISAQIYAENTGNVHIGRFESADFDFGDGEVIIKSPSYIATHTYTSTGTIEVELRYRYLYDRSGIVTTVVVTGSLVVSYGSLLPLARH